MIAFLPHCYGEELIDKTVINISFKNQCPPQEIYFSNQGRYKVEVWGARGGGQLPGKGAYCSAVLRVVNPMRMFAFVGGAGGVPTAGCNGGGRGGDGIGGFGPGGGGGGSTDLRLLNATSLEALLSRVIVAAGGGGTAGSMSGHGSDGGDHASGSSSGYVATPGVSDSGTLFQGANGLGGRPYDCEHEGKGAGGGGFFGGRSNSNYKKSGGTGGTSYISPTLSERIILTGSNVPEEEANGKIRITYLGGYSYQKKCRVGIVMAFLIKLLLCFLQFLIMPKKRYINFYIEYFYLNIISIFVQNSDLDSDVTPQNILLVHIKKKLEFRKFWCFVSVL